MSTRTLTIDGRQVSVQAGQSLLDAARQLGIDIPSLCFTESCGPMNSCQVCLVKICRNGSSQVVPSCGTQAQEGMVVESETDEIHQLRRTALELLFSDHVGDCLAPCHRICPLDLNIPRMIRQVQDQDHPAAIETVRAALALPETLGWLCTAPCQNGCRRGTCDDSASIRELERYIAKRDRAENKPTLPLKKPSSGKKVAIVGAGPTGLTAAYHLLLDGHGCTLIDRHSEWGGSLRAETEHGRLPREVLHAELSLLAQLGAKALQDTAFANESLNLERLTQEYDVVLLTLGALNEASLKSIELATTTAGVRINTQTFETVQPGVFAAGSLVRPVKQLVRAMSEGQSVAGCIHQHLMKLPVRRRDKPLSSIMGRVEGDELQRFLETASDKPRTPISLGPEAGFTDCEAQTEASRCLHCDCRAAGSCDLQHYAEVYGANPNRFSRQRRAFQQEVRPPNVIFESGKCILCGICVHIARQAAEPLGLSFVGRGFDVQVAAPLNHAFSEGLQKVAAECVAHCPTGAIVFADEKTDPASAH